MLEQLRFPAPFPPPFASAWGDDRYGLWADLQQYWSIPMLQRLRWIEPGSFLMGSPDAELGRYPNEGPQHRVRLTAGFWLSDTCCTQTTWRAVLGLDANAPEHPILPIQGVSWLEVQRFLQGMSSILGDCEALLPTEAQWEYACRAGTTTAFNCGDTITRESANFDPHGISDDGIEASTRQVQSGSLPGAPAPVKSFPPNAWGLYEMHGNVWEWCADGLRKYTANPVVDPVGPMDLPSRPRVTRGGSFMREARGIRSADRVFNPTDLRRRDIGFRFILKPHTS